MLINLDYEVKPKPRWTMDNPNSSILNIIKQNKSIYEKTLMSFIKYKNNLIDISVDFESDNPLKPNWVNGYLPGLDAITLYSLLCENNPGIFLEVGSGNSTKFARQAILDYKLKTKIISIDPYPRAEIDSICDEIIRKPVEEIELSIFDKLSDGDFLFIDNSHRVFTNSDVTMMFLDVLPRLKSGVFLEFHDIFLPFDYPEEWNIRFYSEQYMLGAYLLGGGMNSEILLPNWYISTLPELHGILSPLWEDSLFASIEKHGCSFWMIK